MGWRQRFDPARARLDTLRERAKRMRDIRSLRAQVAQVRRVGLRGEVLVPIIAVLILIVTLGLSALSPNSQETIVDAGSTATSVALAPSATVMVPTPSQISGSGYPLASELPTVVTPTEVPTFATTDSISGTDTTTDGQFPAGGYPDPGSQPEGVGEPPSGAVPPSDLVQPVPPVVNPPISSVPVAPPLQLVPSSPPSSTGGYPAPATSPAQPLTSNPQPTAPRPSTQQPSTGTVPQTGGNSSYPAPADDESTDEDENSTSAPTPDSGDTTEPTPAAGAPTAVPTTPPPLTPTPLPPTPTPRPAKVLTGNVRWTAANSPIVVTEDQLVAEGAFLTIEPGVEVRVSPDVRISIAGTLRAGGNAGAPVRMVGPEGRWDGLVGTPGSTIALDGVAIRQAGRNGTAISSSGGTLVLRNSTINDSGGGILALGSLLDLRGTQITGNAIAGPAVNVVLPKQDGSVIAGNIIGGNNTPQGAPQLLVNGEDAPGVFAIEGNQIVGEAGPGALLSSSAPLRGSIRCNSFERGTIGLQLSTQRPSLNGFELAIDTNSFVGQSRFGAAGTLAFNLAQNWWGDSSGPLDAQRNPQGRGVPIGVNLQFQPWLVERPGCAPR